MLEKVCLNCTGSPAILASTQLSVTTIKAISEPATYRFPKRGTAYIWYMEVHGKIAYSIKSNRLVLRLVADFTTDISHLL